MFERDNSPPDNKCCFKPLEEKDFEELNDVRDQVINGFDNHATTGKCRTAEFVFGSVHVRCLSQECGLKKNIKKRVSGIILAISSTISGNLNIADNHDSL